MATLSEFIERGMAFFNGQTVAASELEACKLKLTAAESQVQLTGEQLKVTDEQLKITTEQYAEAKQAIEKLSNERDQLKAAVEKLQTEAQTVDEAASDKAQAIVRAQGIPVSKVPENNPKAASAEAELASLRKQLQTEQDIHKKAEIAARCRELRGHGDLFK